MALLSHLCSQSLIRHFRHFIIACVIWCQHCCYTGHFLRPWPREHLLCQFVCLGVRLLYNPFHFQISSFFCRVFCSERNSLILHGSISFHFNASCMLWCFLCSFVAFWPSPTTLIYIANNSLGIQKQKTFITEVCLWKLDESLLKNPFHLKCNALSQKVSWLIVHQPDSVSEVLPDRLWRHQHYK